MSNDSTTFVGLDVHKDSITVACVGAATADPVIDVGTIGTQQYSIDRLIRKLDRQQSLQFVYEAGPCGFWLQRYLASKHQDCVVAAPSLIPKRPGDRIKTDRRDARNLALALRAATLTPVHIPTPAQEAFRDVVRAWQQAKRDIRVTSWPGSAWCPASTAPAPPVVRDRSPAAATAGRVPCSSRPPGPIATAPKSVPSSSVVPSPSIHRSVTAPGKHSCGSPPAIDASPPAANITMSWLQQSPANSAPSSGPPPESSTTSHHEQNSEVRDQPGPVTGTTRDGVTRPQPMRCAILECGQVPGRNSVMR
jgi:hypothetical protein